MKPHPVGRRGAFACAVALFAGGALAHDRSAPPASCTTLVGLHVEAGSVTDAQRLNPGQRLGGVISDKASVHLCRVQLRLRPASGSDIRAEVWLPEAWNGKLLTYGGGGFSGGSAQSAETMNASAARGYATATSDLGHPVGATARWAHRQPDKVIDFGHRANHVLAIAAKQVIRAFYQAPVQQAYFQGCSGGGREALMAASRYPDDYDGVIAGSPAMTFGDVMAQMIWNQRVLASAPNLHAKLPAVHAAVLRACDRLDGVADGVLENPLQCRFDPQVLRCKVFDTPACLNRAEAAALRRLYEGPRLKSGEPVIAGPAIGSEGEGWVRSALMTDIGGPEFYRWLVYDDPTWSSARFDLDRDHANARDRLGSVVDAGNADIGAFIRRGGKLILVHGWADALVSAANTVRYHGKLRGQFGRRLDDGARLFMVPGLGHCGEGVDMLPALEAWVERQQAPQQVVARAQSGGRFRKTETTRLLCPWPKTAKYTGSGPTTDAARFVCAAAGDPAPPVTFDPAGAAQVRPTAGR